MNQGPLVFLGVFCALALSWFGMLVGPDLQLGDAQPATNMFNPSELYPQMRPGMARQGLEAYRSLGCAACHTQQIGQSGRTYGVLLTDAGTNRPAVVEVVASLRPGGGAADAERLVGTNVVTVLSGAPRQTADAAVARLKAAGARAQLKVAPTGSDIDRGWGARRSVAEDFLYDRPVMLGSQRIGPDLADVGSRPALTAEWHLLHLYNPRIVVPKSVMPPYRFLFEKRRIGREPSPGALKLGGDFAPEAGSEIVPTDEARQLVAYLLSLRADTAIFDTPITLVSQPVPSTNAPAAPAAPAAAAPAP